MAKVLFISRDYTLHNDGGSIVARRNLKFLKSIGLDVDEFIIPAPSLSTRIINLLLRQSYGDSYRLHKKLKKYLHCEFDLIFFDGSLYGKYLQMFSYHGFRTCCFYHNVESSYYSDKYAVTGKLQDKLMIPFIQYNESLSTAYSSYVIMLNQRDSDDLMKTYGRAADFILPTSFKPLEIDISSYQNENEAPKPYLLFIGSKFFANYEGLDFLIKDIAPLIKYDIRVVGNVCDFFKNTKLPDNVILEGQVKDLLPYYTNAECVIEPIFSGSGLKTKTIEALKYGKYIIGSKEAFEGIPSESVRDIGCICMTKSDYVDAINTLNCDKIHNHSLLLFNNVYSDTIQIERLKSFLRDIGII